MIALQAFSSLALMGLIWCVQLVHYPMFERLDRARFGEHLRWHGNAISYLVGPLMIVELICAAWLAHRCPLGLALVVAIWLCTGLIQVPLHNRLCQGYEPRVLARLIQSNWIRTALWTARGILSLQLLREP